MRRHLQEGKETEGRKTVQHHHKNEVPVKHDTSPARRHGGIWTTLDDMERMMEETIHRPFLFDFGFRPISRFLHDLRVDAEINPYVDIYTLGNEVVMKAELPGMKREDISVNVIDNTLTISGEKKNEEKVERKDYLRLESSYGTFNRTLHLPDGCITDKVTATFKDGVLEVRVPRTGSGTAKTITIE